jgi:hypothetical protein
MVVVSICLVLRFHLVPCSTIPDVAFIVHYHDTCARAVGFLRQHWELMYARDAAELAMHILFLTADNVIIDASNYHRIAGRSSSARLLSNLFFKHGIHRQIIARLDRKRSSGIHI